jgi:hypothetical protein
MRLCAAASSHPARTTVGTHNNNTTQRARRSAATGRRRMRHARCAERGGARRKGGRAVAAAAVPREVWSRASGRGGWCASLRARHETRFPLKSREMSRDLGSSPAATPAPRGFCSAGAV